MEDQKKHSEKHGGVFLGVLVGVAATLLVTTKKGRKMLHAFSDEGLTKLGDWEHILADVADAIEDGDFAEGEEYGDTTEPVVTHRVQDMPAAPEAQSDYVPTIAPSSTSAQQDPMPLREQPPWSPPPQPPLVHGEPVTASQQNQEQPHISDSPIQQQHTSHPVSRPRATSRRFFRGIPRR